MAKVNLALFSGEVRGKFGDVVFMRRYGQQIARVRVKPSNPNTPRQQIVRYNLGSLSDAWKGTDTTLKKYNPATGETTDVEFNGLTNAERMAWQDYAMAVKGTKDYGRVLFIGHNQKRLMNNQDPVRTP